MALHDAEVLQKTGKFKKKLFYFLDYAPVA